MKGWGQTINMQGISEEGKVTGGTTEKWQGWGTDHYMQGISEEGHVTGGSVES